MAPSTAASRSASANTMFGLLPPSSKVSRFSDSAADFMMIWPVGLAGERDLVDAAVG